MCHFSMTSKTHCVRWLLYLALVLRNFEPKKEKNAFIFAITTTREDSFIYHALRTDQNRVPAIFNDWKLLTVILSTWVFTRIDQAKTKTSPILGVAGCMWKREKEFYTTVVILFFLILSSYQKEFLHSPEHMVQHEQSTRFTNDFYINFLTHPIHSRAYSRLHHSTSSEIIRSPSSNALLVQCSLACYD